MPRAIVMLRGENWAAIRDKLKDLMHHRFSNGVFNKHGVIIEYFLECFGWFDYLVSLWGANVETLQLAVELLRKECDVYTTTMIGIDPDEREQDIHQLSKTLVDFAQTGFKDEAEATQYLRQKTLEAYCSIAGKLVNEVQKALDTPKDGIRK